MTDQLILKWNNHGIAFNKLLNNIYLKDEYSDGTIFCQGNVYPVHRFVLSTCSEYFEEMFSHCAYLNNKHPFIIVKDLNIHQMEALLNYMYKGEVHVPQEMLPEFIKIAETFKIRGLAVPDKDIPKSRKRTKISSPHSMSKKIRMSDNVQSSISNNICDDSIGNDKINENTDYSDNTSSQFQCSSSYSQDEPIISLEESVATKIKEEPIDPTAIIDMDHKQNSSLSQEGEVDETFLVECGTNNDSQRFDFTNDNFDEGHESTSWEETEDDQTQRLIALTTTTMQHKRRSDHNNEMIYHEMEVVKTQKNKDKLCYNGFMYHQGTKTKTTQCWRCVDKMCKGSASTPLNYAVNRQVTELKAHTHPQTPYQKQFHVEYGTYEHISSNRPGYRVPIPFVTVSEPQQKLEPQVATTSSVYLYSSR